MIKAPKRHVALITISITDGTLDEAVEALKDNAISTPLNNDDDGDVEIIGAVPFRVTDEMVHAAVAKLWDPPEGFGGPVQAAPANFFIRTLDYYGGNPDHPDRKAGIAAYLQAQLDADKENHAIMRAVLEAAFIHAPSILIEPATQE
jgi:hypothetical protein